MNKKLLPITFSILFIVSCGGGGGGGGSTPPTPTTPAPTVNLSAEPTSVLLESTSTLSWSSSNATSCSASWTTQTGTSGSEAVTITTAGNNSFSISCTGAGGTRSASVTVEGYRETDGVVVDGYISGAEVCIDEDESWTCDSNENTTTSDNEGKFTIRYANGNLVSIGGTDLDSQTLLDNLLITHKLIGHSDFKAVTPVTSIAAFMEDSSLVNAALGIDASIDVFTFDPVANKGDGGIYDYLYEKGNQLTVLAFALQNITNNLNTTTETTQDYFKSITEEIEKEYTETETKVDIETEAFITKAIDNVITAKSVTIDESAKANTAKALAGVMPIIEVKSSDDLTTGVIRFAVSTLQTDIQAIANGTATAETVSSYTSDVLAYIAEDQNIDADEITPDISAIADSATTSEDTAVTINVVANDSYLTSAPISVTAGNGTNGTTTIAESSPEQITYEPDADYNGTDTFSYTITQGDKTSSADVTVTIEEVNDEPSIDIASTIQVQENQTAVTTVSVSDVDDDELTLTLGGTDADSFDLSSDNVLTFKEAPDYETKDSYSITLTLTDGTETVTKEVTINIIDLFFLTNDESSGDEDQNITIDVLKNDDITSGTRVLDVSSTTNGSAEWAYTAAILNTYGHPVILYTPDSNWNGLEEFSYQVSFDGITKEANIQLTINPVNDAPFFGDQESGEVNSFSFTIDENQTSIGNIDAYDIEGDTITFELSGSDMDLFSISDAGVLSFIEPPDAETKSFYNDLQVSAKDGGDQFRTVDINISIRNINDNPPEIVTGSTYSAAENQVTVGEIRYSDPDGSNGQYEFILSGTDAEFFTAKSNYIIGSDNFFFKSTPDYETKQIYNLSVTISDGVYEDSKEITVNVTNVNDVAPEFTSNATFSAAENQTAIGTVTATDAEGDDVTFTVSGSELAITSAGVLTFVEAPDYETKATYTATVTASDGTNSTTQNITVNVTDVNEAPAFTSSATFSAAENETAIGTVAASDVDGDTITYSISGSDITINSSSGVIAFASAPDYETKSSYTATVTASDGTNSTTQNITVNVTDVNEAPAFTSSATFSAAENQTAIGTVSASDVDGDTLTYSISGSDITINPSSGVIAFASAPDYETKTSYTATVTTSDGTNSTTQSITVNVTDVNEAPAFTSSATFSADENQTAIGSVSVTDPENETLTYTLTSTDSNLLNISDSGVLTFVSEPNYESKDSYSPTVSVSDGTNTSTQAITINITDVNDAPAISINFPSTFTLAENYAAPSSTVGSTACSSSRNYLTCSNGTVNIGGTATTTTFSDEDGDNLSISFSGTDQSYFSASAGNSIYLTNDADYETKSSYSANVVLSDGSESVTQAFVLNITNVNDNAPVITSSATFSAAENQTSIGTVTATDADGSSITYSISGTDSGSVSINSSSGVLTFNSAPNYESKTSYSIVVTASDGTNSTNQNVTINITNVNEAPAFTSSASFSAAENQTTIGSVSVTDPENATLSYSLSGTDASSLAISSSGVLSFGSAPNYESKNSYSATVAASDGTNSTTQDVTISVTDVNDAPVATAAAYTMNLKPQSQTSVTLTLAGTDEDGDTLTYSIVSNGSYGTASLSGTTITYQTDANTQSAQSESFTFKVNDGTVDSSAATISIDLRTDPLYKYQWHLNNTGQTNFATNAGTSGVDLNVDTVIASGIDGDGVTIAIVDSGLELTHEDLADNIVANKSYDYNNDDNNPEPTGNDGDHGTSVAGIVASVGWNNKGGRGVAPNASLVANNLIAFSANDTGNSDALGGAVSGYFDPTDVDIFNMSFGTGLNSSFPTPISTTYENGLLNGVTNLRSGKGAIYVNSSGNDWYEGTGPVKYCGPNYGASAYSDLFPCWDSSFDKVFATPYIIGVASLNADETRSKYSTPGSSVWVSGFGGDNGNNSSHTGGTYYGGEAKPAIMTVDESSCSKGYVKSGVNAGSGDNKNTFNNGDHAENASCNYTSTFNGTSSAAPTVSGVIALMLEANPSLTWRDVKHILATTSTQIDASNSKTYLTVNQYSWITNAANYKHHNWYGFGKVNAAAAVSSAQSYTVGSLGTAVNTGRVESGTLNATFNSFTRTTMSGDNDLVVVAPAGSSGKVEFVRIGISMTHASPNHVGIELLSPDGTTVPILPAFTRVTTNPNGSFFEIGVNSLYGENMAGTWTLIVTDYTDDSVGGILNAWDINVYGR